MVHLAPLPGSPGYEHDFDSVISAAVADARVLAEAGFDAVGIENFGDAPFFADDVPKLTIAAMTRAVAAVGDAIDVPVGVNVLRNDALGALAVAAATGAAFIRVNVLAGSMWTDQGLVTGRAAELMRLRAAIAPTVAVFADVFVKHAVPPAGSRLDHAAEEVALRGRADGLIVSGTATGRPPTVDTLCEVAAAVPATPVYVGSGTDLDNVGEFLASAHGVIIGTALKYDRVTTNPVDPERAKAFVTAARAVRP